MNALSWLSIAALIALIYGPVQSLLESIARHHLFVMRDELFNKARHGETSFDADEYRQARRQLNSLIRFTHITKWHNVMLIGKLLRIRQPEQSMSPLYLPFRNRVAAVLLLLVIMRSPFMIAFTLLTGMIGFLRLNMIQAKRKVLKVLHVIEQESLSV